MRIKHAIVLSLVCIVVVIAYWFEKKDVVQFQSTKRDDYRGRITVVIDPAVLSYERTRKFVLAHTSGDSVSEVEFETRMRHSYGAENVFREMFIFGKHAQSIADIQPLPLRVVAICPTGDPPRTGNTRMAALLCTGPEFTESSKKWKAWCMRYHIPFEDLKSLSDENLRDGLANLSQRP